ncbi:hypothetical protein [Maribacter polysaccharolyticus]|uniref:hypothetical protein n=1 Tax=Maribacter polysaccharolyticus TaxID=3020831 RepID=UPI00237F7F34|nr:hypothetical protein [Maribacter polysaccharolyticus]MDE3744138.1 hypothetical protein [Maribacter polysaccharolyticus]
MNYEIPNAYNWFAKLNLTQFIPWNFETEINSNSSINERFKIECEQNREVLTFGRRQDMDTFVGFEIVSGKVTEKVIVFHPSFGTNVKGWNIIESEHSDFFDFMHKRVLPEMKEWIPEDDVNDYIETK